MQRVDAGYLYELGDLVRALKAFRGKSINAYEVWGPLNKSRQAIYLFVGSSVYSSTIRNVYNQSTILLNEIDSLIEKISSGEINLLEPVHFIPLAEAYDKFEPALHSALSMQVLYHVTPKGAYDVVALVENGKALFPESVSWKVPEAIRDVEEGAKALAFELWSSAAFHFHRANEAVLRRYFDHHLPGKRDNKKSSMGALLSQLQNEENINRSTIVALQNIKEFHRNPNAHPGDFIENSDQALSLLSAIRAAMGYMLEELPPSFEEAMLATENPEAGQP